MIARDVAMVNGTLSQYFGSGYDVVVFLDQFGNGLAGYIAAAEGKDAGHNRAGFHALFLADLAVDFPQPILDAPQCLVGGIGWCAFIHLEFNLEEIRGHVGEKDKTQDSAGHQADRQDQQRDKHRDRQVAVFQGFFQERAVNVVDEMVQPFAEETLEADKHVVRFWLVALDLHVREHLLDAGALDPELFPGVAPHGEIGMEKRMALFARPMDLSAEAVVAMAGCLENHADARPPAWLSMLKLVLQHLLR